MPGPLNGYRVVDLTSNVSGPLATMILGDQGAEVIKVEPLDGDHTRAGANRRGGVGAHFLYNHPSKGPIFRDLTKPGAVRALKGAAGRARLVRHHPPPRVARPLAHA